MIPQIPRAVNHRRPTWGDGFVALAVLAAATLLFFAQLPAPSNFLTATIVLDNVTVATCELSALQGRTVIPVPDCPYPVTIEAQPGRIRIAQSDCPGGDCVRTGWADRPGAQIICLPNKLIISLTGGSHTPNTPVDGITH